MIALPSGVRALPVDFRKGMDGPAAVVKEHLGADPFCGTIFVFRAKRADRVKLIVWDRTGLCLFAKRLEQVAEDRERHDRLTPSQLAALIEGDRLKGFRHAAARVPH